MWFPTNFQRSAGMDTSNRVRPNFDFLYLKISERFVWHCKFMVLKVAYGWLWSMSLFVDMSFHFYINVPFGLTKAEAADFWYISCVRFHWILKFMWEIVAHLALFHHITDILSSEFTYWNHSTWFVFTEYCTVSFPTKLLLDRFFCVQGINMDHKWDILKSCNIFWGVVRHVVMSNQCLNV